jgi:hypothetical protein
MLLYATTLFVSAFLLFTIQPMAAKSALPLLGGSPEVWNTAMVFFQATLLLGYGYAHINSLLGPRRQLFLHFLVLALALATLPIGAVAWSAPTEQAPALWLIGYLAASIGLPFFVVSATAPMLQRWFSRTDHPAARDPYFLYGASNLGSILALLGYPIVVERELTIRQQEWAWSGGYVALVALIGVCALLVWRRPADTPFEQHSSLGRAGQPDWARRGLWIILAFVPSSLLLGVTSHISTNIAAAPLFWVVPLMLYLLTFVLVFARRQIVPHKWMVNLQPILLIPLALLFDRLIGALWLPGLALHLLTFFVIAMVCHGELAQRRPPSTHLTEFYLWMSVGGVLGGMFNALLAPIIFNDIYEYPLVLGLACLLRPRRAGGAGRWFPWIDLVVPGVLFVVLAMPMMDPSHFDRVAKIIFYVVVGGILLALSRRRLGFALAFAAVIFSTAGLVHRVGMLEQERSFFGVNRVLHDSSGKFTLLIHGTVLHGAQHQDPALRREPLSYYSKEGPLGQLFEALAQRGGIDRVGVAGLGVGTMTCYRRPGQHWTYFEIDPVVVRLARDSRYFHYLEDCIADTSIMLGDARISLLKGKRGEFDLLIFDAFSSESIPVHLLTQEALALYVDRLSDDGVLAFHVTNRHLDLQPVLADLAIAADLVARVQSHKATAEMREHDYKRSSDWVVMTRHARNLGMLLSDERWQPLVSQRSRHLWTDDYSNIPSAMRWEWLTFH